MFHFAEYCVVILGNVDHYAPQITPCLPQTVASSPVQAVFRQALVKSKTNNEIGFEFRSQIF
jgi:hypothetical protein